MASTAWKVYELRNDSLRELYYGVSVIPGERLATRQSVREAAALQHWDCDEDVITGTGTILAEFDTQHEAADHAHALELKTPPSEWTVLQAAGV